jgi:LytS/YehU family sensor histidine kinase
MTNAINRTIVFKSVKTRTAAAVTAIVSAVALPQIFHLIGTLSGTGTVSGEIFLPMHLAIFMVGFLAGPVVGGISGALAPLISFALTGMPTFAMLPYMMIELAVYGIVSGLTANTDLPVIVKLLIAQVAGRLIRGGAIMIGYYAFSSVIKPEIILTSIRTGIPGLILQWILIPLLMFRIAKMGEADEQT